MIKDVHLTGKHSSTCVCVVLSSTTHGAEQVVSWHTEQGRGHHIQAADVHAGPGAVPLSLQGEGLGPPATPSPPEQVENHLQLKFTTKLCCRMV